MEQIEILTTKTQVAELAELLIKETSIAIDLEADSMHNYQEKVCLIQVSTEQKTVLIDPLAAKNLSPLQAVFTNPDIRKIFHAADYDLRSLKRDFNLTINGLFDTMIACRLVATTPSCRNGAVCCRRHLSPAPPCGNFRKTS
jgi:ribonuclease D